MDTPETEKSLIEIFNQSVTRDQRIMSVSNNRTTVDDWKHAIKVSGTIWSWGRADGTFKDIIAVLQGKKLSKSGLDFMMYGYNLLLQDTKTPQDILAPFIAPMSEAFVKILQKEPLERQYGSGVVGFREHYLSAMNSGRFNQAQISYIKSVTDVILDNFNAQYCKEHGVAYTSFLTGNKKPPTNTP